MREDHSALEEKEGEGQNSLLHGGGFADGWGGGGAEVLAGAGGEALQGVAGEAAVQLGKHRVVHRGQRLAAARLTIHHSAAHN